MLTMYQWFDVFVVFGVLVTTAGIPTFFLIWKKFDKELIIRRKAWEELNKDSLLEAINNTKAEGARAIRTSEENQEKMRQSLHELRKQAQRTSLENDSLREEMEVLRREFLELSRILKLTDLALHKANENMLSASRKLAESMLQLECLRKELEVASRERDELTLEVRKLRELFEQGRVL